jgi:hypothetical protein
LTDVPPESAGSFWSILAIIKPVPSGRKVMSVVAKEYGYKVQEIAGYLCRDPAVIFFVFPRRVKSYWRWITFSRRANYYT